jgi:NADH-quinone oxidoreductase subunit N
MSTNVLALLPELILTLTGVLVMLAEPCLAPASSRKPLGWIAIAGTVGALFASWYQVSLGTLHAFSNTIQVDAFSVLFHFVIGAVVLVTLLVSLDYFEGNASHAGEYFALLCFGAVGMMLMTCSVELLLHLHPLRLPQRPGHRHRVLDQVLPARLLRHRLLPLWHRPRLRGHRLD